MAADLCGLGEAPPSLWAQVLLCRPGFDWSICGKGLARVMGTQHWEVLGRGRGWGEGTVVRVKDDGML